VNDLFEPRPTNETGRNHTRLDGVESGGVFCMLCGGPMEVGEEGHGNAFCDDNFDLVNELRRINGW
jgi:hypothetical protein